MSSDGAHSSPTWKMMLSAENIRNLSFETRFGPGMLLEEPGRMMPQGQAASRVTGGPRSAPSPPTVPGAPLRD
jgi:hypothetical protein